MKLWQQILSCGQNIILGFYLSFSLKRRISTICGYFGNWQYSVIYYTINNILIIMIWTSQTLTPIKFKKNDNHHDLTTEDILTIKTGELIAKTQELDEVNESLYLSNSDLQVKIDEIKKSKNDLLKSDNSLLLANEELA